MTPVLQNTIPYDPLSPLPLPGIRPLDMDGWLLRDDAFAGQMRERDRLLDTARPQVLALDESARTAARELLDLVLGLAFAGAGAGAVVTRPDGISLRIERDDPLGTVGRLVQEDMCILQKRGDEHVLTGAVLCFPASWKLSEKFMRPLIGIHAPVQGYDRNIAARVQRLFDGVRAGRPLWRFNALWYDDPALHQPRGAQDAPRRADPETAPYLRSERQCILRLPQSGAAVFSIHTYILPRAAVHRAGQQE